ncbi:MAG TPA: RluA family pseudouridine synthase [Acidimicrobiia bacterium]|nr:RluA family pseudouridine synthase [Acidimicrobiia bacterium]
MTGEPDEVPRERFPVPASLAGERIDRAVALITGWSRADVAGLIDAGSVRVGGRPVAKSRRLAEGEEVEVEGEPETEAPPKPEPVDFTVVHADDDLVVLVKPAGLVVHPGAGHEEGTLASGLLHRFPEIAGVGDPMRPGIVHRLDRDTSGLMVVARSPRAYDVLTSALAAREIERRYLALAWGRFDARRGTIDAPIGRSATRRTRMAIREAGKDARTGYEVLAQYEHPVCALVECRLETGRTHQIRVHLAAIGHPIVGDGTYGGDRNPLRPGRPFLHAHALAVEHPVTGERLEFTDPLPPELAAVLTTLGDPPAPRP